MLFYRAPMISSQHQRIKFSPLNRKQMQTFWVRQRNCESARSKEIVKHLDVLSAGSGSLAYKQAVPLHSLVSRANNNEKFLLLSHQTDYLLLTSGELFAGERSKRNRANCHFVSAHSHGFTASRPDERTQYVMYQEAGISRRRNNLQMRFFRVA